MLEVVEKSAAQLGGHRRVLCRVRTKAEGEAFIREHIGDRKVRWLSHTVEEMNVEEERAAIQDLEREERLLAIEERKMELAERETRLALMRKMAVTAGKPEVDAAAAVRSFLERGPAPKVGRPEVPDGAVTEPNDTTDPTE